jgi:hypothetical protein
VTAQLQQWDKAEKGHNRQRTLGRKGKEFHKVFLKRKRGH